MNTIADDATTSKKKRGDVREDGRIFWRYKTSGGEVWVKPEDVEERRALEYARSKASAEKRRLRVMPTVGERVKMGHVRSDGMIFWAYSPDGTEQWFTEEGMREKREKSKQAKKKCYANNSEKHLARAKKWRENNPEKHKESEKSSRIKNREKRMETTKDWRERNMDHVKSYAKKYQTENGHVRRTNMNRRYAEDKLFNLRCRMRARTVIAFRQKGFSKDTKTATMLGCTWEELKAHIESQFTDGMSWDRFEDIEIDHVTPVASAKTKEELIPLFRYTNLQPLWWWDNRLKRDKTPEEWKIIVDGLR